MGDLPKEVEPMPDWDGTPTELFEAVRQGMGAQLTATAFDMYYEPLHLIGYDGETFTIDAPANIRGWCKIYATGDLQRLLKRELGRAVSVVFVEHIESDPQMFLFEQSEVIDVGEDNGRDWW